MISCIVSWWNRWMLNPKALMIAEDMRKLPTTWVAKENPFSGGQFYTLDKDFMRIWIGNGWWFIGIDEPVEEKLGLLGRTLVYLASRKPLRMSKKRCFAKNSEIIDKWRNK